MGRGKQIHRRQNVNIKNNTQIMKGGGTFKKKNRKKRIKMGKGEKRREEREEKRE